MELLRGGGAGGQGWRHHSASARPAAGARRKTLYENQPHLHVAGDDDWLNKRFCSLREKQVLIGVTSFLWKRKHEIFLYFCTVSVFWFFHFCKMCTQRNKIWEKQGFGSLIFDSKSWLSSVFHKLGVSSVEKLDTAALTGFLWCLQTFFTPQQLLQTEPTPLNGLV